MQSGFIIDYNTIAAHLALANDEDQAEFFREFFHELRAACETNHNTEMQLHMINARLLQCDRDLLTVLGLSDEDESHIKGKK